MSERVLITGAEGFVGSVLAPFLRARGFEVTGLDTGFFADALLYPVPPFPIIRKDAREVTSGDIAGYDAVVHLAGISINDPFGQLPPERIYGPTRDYARAIAKLCKESGTRFIFASSCSIYGTSGEELTEDSPVHPHIEYSRNKLQVEQDLAALAGQGFSPIALRFATAFGLSPRMRFDIALNMFCGQAVAEGKIVLNSDGQAWRPFVHVEDMARAVACALRSGYAGEKLLVLNVGSEENNIKIIDAARIVSEESGVPIEFSVGGVRGAGSDLVTNAMVSASGADARNYRVSFARIQRHFPDFACRCSIRDGVREMLERLHQLSLTLAQFKDRGFYRIKRLEDLYSQGEIDGEVRWKK